MDFEKKDDVFVVSRDWRMWVQLHRNQILSGVLTGLVVIFAIFYWVSAPGKGDKTADFEAATAAYQAMQRKEDGALERLQALLRKHPELHGKYDPLIGQKLLIENHDLSIASQSLKRTNLSAPQYAQFAQTSLLIASGEHVKALEEAQKLKVALQAEQEGVLYGFNLLRIAMLEQKIGTPARELAAWEELQKNPHPELNQAFHDGDISLTHYINQRITHLRVHKS